MNLQDHYDELYKDSIQKINSNNYQTDSLIDSIHDKRSGITLLIRPDDKVKSNIRKFISALESIDNHQYYYPDSDIHVTVMSIISCYEGFNLENVNVPQYVEIIKRSIAAEKSFEIEFKGVTASPSCILIQGFLKDETLNSIRNNLRTNFRNSDLEQTIDKRYSIQTAHATVVRFRKELMQKNDYINVLNAYRDFDFGSCSVNSLELVHNDWYHRARHEKELYKFEMTTG